MSSAPCPPQAVLEQLFAAGLPPDEALRVRSHVADCPTCAAALFQKESGVEENATTGVVGAPAAPRAEQGDFTPLTRGTTLGRYVVLDTLGAGGMGVVYAAFDPELDRKVALKLLQTSTTATPTSTGPEAQALLLREAQAMARLSHPNVIAVHDVGTHGTQVFIAMELVDGVTLRAWLKAKSRPWTAAVAMLVEAGRGLAAAHAAGLIHRDFKPDNVLVGQDGRARVMDFGLARAAVPDSLEPVEDDVRAPVTTPRKVGSFTTEAGRVVGTPAYLSPEQYQGLPADERSDQFSFGVSLYEALYGERPFLLQAEHRPLPAAGP